MTEFADKRIESPEELEFVVFCIEGVATRLGIPGDAAYRALAVRSDILSGYIVPGYDALHTQGREYVVDEIVALMEREGVVA